MQQLGSDYFFTADDGVVGRELWKTDGTRSGTKLVADVAPGPASSNPSQLTIAGAKLFFTAAGRLWISDGTSAGTKAVAASPRVTSLSAFGARVAFSDDQQPASLWISDGTSSGTQKVATGVSPTSMIALDAKTLVFSGSDTTSGRELWRSDGSAAGTVAVRDIYPGSTGSEPGEFRKVGTEVFFTAFHPWTGRELWKTDGTALGSVAVKNIGGSFGSDPQLRRSVLWNGHLYFGARGQLWRSDGTTRGTDFVADIDPVDAAVFQNRLYFSGIDHATNTVWFGSTDGSSSGTTKLADLDASRLTVVGARLVFTVRGPSQFGVELYSSDGTSSGTRIVKELNPTGDGLAWSDTQSPDSRRS